MKNIFLYIVLMLSLTACDDFFDSEIEGKDINFTPKLVVGSIIGTNQDSIRAYIGKTQPIYGSVSSGGFNYVNDAEFIISNSTDQLSVPHYTQSNTPIPYNYAAKNNFVLKQGEKYKIEVRKEGFETATAEAIYPNDVDVDNVVIDFNDIKTDFDGYQSHAFDLTINDDPNVENYYRIKAYREDGETITYLSEFDITYSVNPIFEQSLFWNQLLISDETFNGEKKELSFLLNEVLNPEENSIYVSVIAISKEQYDYERREVDIDNNAQNPFVSPSPTLTNIKNGLGFFGLENVNTIKAEIKK